MLADGPRPSGPSRALPRDAKLDRAVVCPIRQAMVAGVGVSGTSRGADGAQGVRAPLNHKLSARRKCSSRCLGSSERIHHADRPKWHHHRWPQGWGCLNYSNKGPTRGFLWGLQQIRTLAFEGGGWWRRRGGIGRKEISDVYGCFASTPAELRFVLGRDRPSNNRVPHCRDGEPGQHGGYRSAPPPVDSRRQRDARANALQRSESTSLQTRHPQRRQRGLNRKCGVPRR